LLLLEFNPPSQMGQNRAVRAASASDTNSLLGIMVEVARRFFGLYDPCGDGVTRRPGADRSRLGGQGVRRFTPIRGEL
jgi:hypothetical protein